MARRLGGCALALLAVLAGGSAGAGARAVATTTVIVQVSGGGSVTGGGGQINCGGGQITCYATYVSGTTVTLTATGTSSWSFGSWAGCSTSSTTTCTVNIDGSAHELTAHFAPIGASPGTSTLTVATTLDASGLGGEVTGGSGQIDCGSSGSDCTWSDFTGSTLTVVETPDTGYTFGGWGGACSGTATSCSVTMNADRSVSASFAQSATTTTLTVSVSGNGTVTGGGISCTSAGGTTCSANEAANAPVTLTATPGASAGFTAWGGACAGSTPTCVVTMDSSKTVTAAFTGAGSSTGSTFPLAVTVTGAGTVSVGGIDCTSAGGSGCSRTLAAGTRVTLTAKPTAGAPFSGWGGACSGTATTCTLTATGPLQVTATFGGVPAGKALLTVSVSGPGTVTGGGISCGNGAQTCTAEQTQGATVTLRAAPATGASFAGWGGACRSATTTCRVATNATTSVTAAFTGASAAPPGASALRSAGRPLVRTTSSGFAVTLRLRTSRSGEVQVRAERAGRVEAAFSFAAPGGATTVGPFPLTKPGFYRFQVTLAGSSLHWTACLGRCGAAAASGPFALVGAMPAIARSGRLWSVTIELRSTQPAGADLRISRSGRPMSEVRFPLPAGSIAPRRILLAPGGYDLRLTGTDAYGRHRVLAWVVVLP
jgi:hypothetical protein